MKKYLRQCLQYFALVVVVGLCPLALFAQAYGYISANNRLRQPIFMPRDITVTGKVISSNGEELPGVSVVLKNTTTGTVTDINGKYSLTIPDGSSLLIFSFIGYVSQEISLNGQTTVNISLQQDIKQLSEVVVVGYGTVKRSDLTGAVSTIKSEDIKSQGNNTAERALQGKIAGVNIESSGGSPGSGMRVLVRGIGSLSNSGPLYIVDGVQVDNINNLLPSDIESIDVSKDAAAAAIYGARAANGVIIVTTKSGKKGQNKIDFQSYIGMQQVTRKLDVLNAKEWAQVNNVAHDADGQARLPMADNPSLGAGTNWQDQIYKTAPAQSYNLNLSGGSDNLTYSLSGGYFDQDGIVKLTNYNRANLRIKTDFIKGRIKIGETAILSRENYRNMTGSWGQGGNPVSSAPKMIPAVDVYDPSAIGGYAGNSGSVVDVGNPLAMLNLIDSKSASSKVVLNLYAEISLFKGLKYKYNVGFNNTYGYDNTYTYAYTVGSQFTNLNNAISEYRNTNTFAQHEHTFSYSKNIGKHDVNAVAGYSFIKNSYRDLFGSIKGMPDGIRVASAGSVSPSVPTSYENNYVFLSYFGRINYSYDSRYLFSATFRRDGSSRFGKTNQYGNFSSLSAGWNISNEKFFTNITNIVNTLKIRASYGMLGNANLPGIGSYDNGGNYRYAPVIVLNDNYVIGQTPSLWSGAIQQSFASPTIKWESAATTNFGVDAVFFQNRLSLTADYFIKKNSDILLDVPIPLSAGASNSPTVNFGDITNKGLELLLSYSDRRGDFNYGASATFTSIKNKVDKLGTGTQEISGGKPTHHDASSTLTKAGEPVGEFYLIKTAGIFNSDEEIQAYQKDGKLIQPLAKPGDIKFMDFNGDGAIDDKDRLNVGNPNPKFSLGLSLNGAWKGIDINVFFQGTYGNKIYNGLRQDLERINLQWNYDKATLNAWTPDNHSDFPRATVKDLNNNGRVSDRFLEDGSYTRIKTLQIGYSFPAAMINTLGISKLRAYLSFDNLVTITKYKGYNPDIGRSGSVLDRGVDFGHVAYPLPRTSVAGIQITF